MNSLVVPHHVAPLAEPDLTRGLKTSNVFTDIVNLSDVIYKSGGGETLPGTLWTLPSSLLVGQQMLPELRLM